MTEQPRIRIRSLEAVRAGLIAAGKVSEAGIASILRDVEMEHRDGVAWYAAPIPRRWHRCTPQTTGWIGFDQIHRCACGAIRRNGRVWLRRNDRRRNDR